MPRKRQLSPEAMALLRALAQQREAMPSDKQLAARLGISVRAIQHWMAKLRKNEVSCGTVDATMSAPQ